MLKQVDSHEGEGESSSEENDIVRPGPVLMFFLPLMLYIFAAL